MLRKVLNLKFNKLNLVAVLPKIVKFIKFHMPR